MNSALFITPRVPAPLDDGWKIRTFHLIKGFVQNGWLVDMLSFCRQEQCAGDFPELQSLCRGVHLVPRAKSYAPSDLLRGLVLPTPFHVHNYYVSAMAGNIRQRNMTSYDVVQIESVVMAQYARNAIDRAVRILDMHNVESDLLRRYAENETNLFKKMYAKLSVRKLERYETKIAHQFHQVLACSQEDKDMLQRNGVGIPVKVVPNGVDCNYFQPAPQESETNELVFVGAMDYHANISGVMHFAHNILPLIWKQHPELRFFIVGKNPPEVLRKLAGERIVVTGTVQDVRPYFARAGVVIVPLLVGGGTRLKILESMAMGKAIVSTSLGAEGIPARNGEHLLLADAPIDFAGMVVELIRNRNQRLTLGGKARQFVKQHFDWPSITNAWYQDLQGLIKSEDHVK